MKNGLNCFFCSAGRNKTLRFSSLQTKQNLEINRSCGRSEILLRSMSTSFLFPESDRFDGKLNGPSNVRKGPERIKFYRSLFGSQHIRHRSSIPSDGLTFRDFLSNPVKNTKINDNDPTGETLSYDKVMSSATNPSFLNLDIKSGLEEGEDVNRDILEVEGILSQTKE